MVENEKKTLPQPVVGSNLQLKRKPGRPPTTGAYSKYTLEILTQSKIKEICNIMNDARLAIAPSDMLYISILGRCLAQLDVMDKWFQIHGFLRDNSKGEPYPIVHEWGKLAERAAKMLDRLGMTPTSRYQLGRTALQAEDIASKILKAREEKHE